MEEVGERTRIIRDQTMKKRYIYLDMDGVLANYHQHIMDVFGVPFNRVGVDSVERWELITTKCPDIYANLQELPDADALVAGVIEACVDYDYTPAILTAIPKYGRLKNAEKHKREWIRQRWPVLLREFNIGPHAVDKQNHAHPGDILIDDSPLNIPQWINRGGIGILHTSATDTLHKLFAHMETTHAIS